MRATTAPLLIGALLALTAAARGETAWHTYANDRYGVIIDYPDFFHPLPPPDNDDGRAFDSADGGHFTVSGSLNALDFTLATYQDFIVKNRTDGAAITYQAHGSNWFVVSGTQGDKLFYERHLMSHRGEVLNNFVISYPAALKQTYDPVVTRMSRSLRPGVGFQTPRKP
jgi:hypothetical protein